MVDDSHVDWKYCRKASAAAVVDGDICDFNRSQEVTTSSTGTKARPKSVSSSTFITGSGVSSDASSQLAASGKGSPGYQHHESVA